MWGNTSEPLDVPTSRVHDVVLRKEGAMGMNSFRVAGRSGVYILDKKGDYKNLELLRSVLLKVHSISPR
jgi:hypothetical protein